MHIRQFRSNPNHPTSYNASILEKIARFKGCKFDVNIMCSRVQQRRIYPSVGNGQENTATNATGASERTQELGIVCETFQQQSAQS
ncbi:hypothetical protein AC249_AIPGENE4657 [Exaiptasia diaphana]|nr:hypothetical protein AC249_AIPGENE4657 [Exaiptasia diaphana]